VPLDLSWASVHHGRGEDGHDGGLGVKDALLHDSVMLLNPDVQGNIVVLGETAERMEEEYWVLWRRSG